MQTIQVMEALGLRAQTETSAGADQPEQSYAFSADGHGRNRGILAQGFKQKARVRVVYILGTMLRRILSRPDGHRETMEQMLSCSDRFKA